MAHPVPLTTVPSSGHYLWPARREKPVLWIPAIRELGRNTQPWSDANGAALVLEHGGSLNTWTAHAGTQART